MEVEMESSSKEKESTSDSDKDNVSKKFNSESESSEKVSIEELKEEIANASSSPDCPSEDLACLQEALADAEQVLNLITMLDLNKTRTRTRQTSPKKFKISLQDLEILSAEIERQIVDLPQGQCVHDLYNAAKAMEEKIEELLNEPLDKIESVKGMVDLLDEIDALDVVNLKRTSELSEKINRVKWYKKSLLIGKHEEDIYEWDIQEFQIPLGKDEFKKFLEEGRSLECHGLRKNLVEMEGIWNRIIAWDNDAHNKITQSFDYADISDLEKFLSDGEDIASVCRPEYLTKFKSAVQRSKDWIKLIEKLRTIEYYPNLQILQNLVRLGDLLPFKFLEVDHLKIHVENGLEWIRNAEVKFFGEHHDETKSLLKMLCPENFPEQIFLQPPSEVVATFKKFDNRKRTGPLEVMKPESLRPTLDEVLQLLLSLQNLPMRIPEGEVLLCLTERAMSWEDKCKAFLSKRDIIICLEKIDEGREDCEIELSKGSQEELEDLIFEGESLEISLANKICLWRLYNAFKKASSQTPVKKQIPVAEVLPQVQQTLQPEPSEVLLGKRLRKSKNDDEEKAEPKKKTKKNFKSNNKKIEKVSSSDDEDDEEECSAENCLNPTGREVDWVQCDGNCNKWFHMACVGIRRNDVRAEDDYICIRCSSTKDVSSINKV